MTLISHFTTHKKCKKKPNTNSRDTKLQQPSQHSQDQTTSKAEVLIARICKREECNGNTLAW